MRMILSLLALQLLLVFTELPVHSQITGANWLSKIPDDAALQTLHIPGTHNSAAHYEPLPGTAKCQNLSIAEQLLAGVRFFDIRCRHQNDRFDLYHGLVEQEQTFTELQQTIAKFLESNPGEVLLISIQETFQAKNNSCSFPKTFLHYQKQSPKLWSPVTTVPKLAQARGKAILLRRFRSPNPLGIPATNWKHGDVHRTKQLLIQDYFKVKQPTSKWTHIEQLWKKQPQHPGLLALNFTSGYRPGGFGVPNITAVSDHINPLLQTKLCSDTPPPPGVLIVDHITAELATAIYQLNLDPKTPRKVPHETPLRTKLHDLDAMKQKKTEDHSKL